MWVFTQSKEKVKKKIVQNFSNNIENEKYGKIQNYNNSVKLEIILTEHW